MASDPLVVRHDLVFLDVQVSICRSNPCSSLFTYRAQVLRLSEHAAYGWIEAARVARKFPVVLDLLAEGAVIRTTITLLGPILTPDNHQQVLTETRHRSKREVVRCP